MEKRILHLLHPDKKFLNLGIEFFEFANPGMNRFILLVDKSEVHKWIGVDSRIEVVEHSGKSSRQIIGDIKDFDAIITYALDVPRARLVQCIPEQIVKVLLIFGFEYYDTFSAVKNRILMDKSKSLLSSGLKTKILRSHFYQLIQKLRGKELPEREFIQAFRKIDVVGTFFQEEAENMNHDLSLNMRWIPWSFFSLDHFEVLPNSAHTKKEKWLLLGNSSSITNNHMEAMDVLKDIKEEDFKVYVPLNYGDDKYAQLIKQYGEKVLKDRFIPLMDFIPRQEYNYLLGRFSFAVMNHIRQQALGNVWTLLYLGVKLYFNPENVTYQNLLSRGVHVYSLEDLKDDVKNGLSPLSEEKSLGNKNFIREHFTKEAVLNLNKRFYQSIFE
jgi:dTDP-N-acetylfucosamine:lipid II N-acetylfucosaminyltransferase